MNMPQAGADAYFSPCLADAANYPPPRVPLMQYLNAENFLPPARTPPITGASRSFTISGRAALARIIAETNLAAGARVLLPAYHCPSMVEPFRHAGSDLRFYPLTAALSPEPEAFSSLLAQGAELVLFVDFFGLRPQHAMAVGAARAAGAVIVHDCAHALFALEDIPDSDFAIASLVKFLPVEEGGILQYPRNHTPRALDAPCSPRRNLQMMSRAFARRAAARTARQGGREPIPFLPRPALTPCSTPPHFDSDSTRESICWWTAALLRFCVGGDVAHRRRANYETLLAHTASLRGLRPLAARLPAGAVPYVFPVLLECGSEQFHLLRSAGLPLYRWEQLAPSACNTSQHYREALVQLPCHQDLGPADLAVIMRALSYAACNSHGR